MFAGPGEEDVREPWTKAGETIRLAESTTRPEAAETGRTNLRDRVTTDEIGRQSGPAMTKHLVGRRHHGRPRPTPGYGSWLRLRSQCPDQRVFAGGRRPEIDEAFGSRRGPDGDCRRGSETRSGASGAGTHRTNVGIVWSRRSEEVRLRASSTNRYALRQILPGNVRRGWHTERRGRLRGRENL